MRIEIKRLTRRLGLTTLYVTHDQTEALSLADKVCVMRLGEIMDSGTPEQVYTKPKNHYTAQFVGQMVFVSGRARDVDTVESTLGTVTCRLPEGLRPGDAVTLGIRPEHIEASLDNADDGTRIEGEVLQRLFLGDAVLYEVQIRDTIVSAKFPSSLKATTGDRLYLRFPSDRWHVFPREDKE